MRIILPPLVIYLSSSYLLSDYYVPEIQQQKKLLCFEAIIVIKHRHGPLPPGAYDVERDTQ